jgi:hypothetical protein
VRPVIEKVRTLTEEVRTLIEKVRSEEMFTDKTREERRQRFTRRRRSPGRGSRRRCRTASRPRPPASAAP